MSPPGRALASLLVALLIAGPAAAQDPIAPSALPDTSEPLPEVACDPTLGNPCLPDLLPTNPSATADDESQPVQLCTDFINLGDGPTAAAFSVLLSIDDSPYGERQFSDAYQVGEGEGSICWDGIRLGRGRHTFTVFVDSTEQVLEKNETNNQRISRFYVGPTPQTDLELTSLVVTPREGGPGDIQLFIVNITNVGAAPSNATTIHLEDEIGMVVDWPVRALDPAEKLTFVHATRPDVRPVGTFFVRAVVDANDTIPERNEDNNERLAGFTILEHPAPDYVIGNVTTHGNHREMRGVRIDVPVRNVGDRAVAGTIVWLLNDTGFLYAQAVTRQLIQPGETSIIQVVLALPAGNHSFLAVADPHRLVPERNETNNVARFALEILAAPVHLDLPNLVVERVYAMPEDPRPGELVSVGALVRNIGTNRSNATTVEFRVEGGIIATASVPALAPNASHAAYVPWGPGESGGYQIVAQVDVAEKVREIEEEDNALGLDFLVTRERPPAQEPPPATPTLPPPAPPTPTPPAPTPPASRTPSVVVGDLIVATSEGDDGARGAISISLRNPSIEPLGLVTVTFKVDDDVVKDVLIQGIRGAATTAATTGEIDLPAGTHKVRAEVRIVGTTVAPIVREGEYTQDVAALGIPGFEAALLAAAIACALLLARRRR